MSKTYSASHYEHIDRAEKEHFWFVGRNEMICALIRRYVIQPQGKTFLDIGCGTGVIVELLEKIGFVTTGLDVNARALLYAKQKTQGTLVRSSIFQYRPRQRFTAVGAFDVMEHIRDDTEFLARCNKLLVPGGFLFLTVPADPYLWSSVDVHSGHIRRYTKEELQNHLTQSGFRISYMGYWNSLLLPFYMMWRLVAGDSIQMYLKKPNVIINSVFLFLLRLEGVGHFPFGATLVVAAQKI